MITNSLSSTRTYTTNINVRVLELSVLFQYLQRSGYPYVPYFTKIFEILHISISI